MWGDEFGRMNRRVIEKGQVEELTFDSWRTTTELSACLFPACGSVRWKRGFVTLQVCMCSSPGVELKDCRTGQVFCGLCRLLWRTFSKLHICWMMKSWVKPLVPMAAGTDSFLWSKWSLRLSGFIIRIMKLYKSESPFWETYSSLPCQVLGCSLHERFTFCGCEGNIEPWYCLLPTVHLILARMRIFSDV